MSLIFSKMKQGLNKILFFGLLFLGLVPALAVNAQPVCPICVVAIGAGLGFSRWLGVDDLISSVWIGAVLLTLVIWTLYWIRKKNWDFKFSGIVIFLFYYLFTFIPLYYLKIVGHPLNTVFGIDKIVFGAFFGTVILALSLWFHSFLKKKNNDKSYFPYQRVFIPVFALILPSFVFYLLLIWRII